MSVDENAFDRMFSDDPYGPRNGFVPRVWQYECANDYAGNVAAFRARHTGNGVREQHRFTIYAGTGSGKTKAAAFIASRMLNEDITQIVVVCPNRSILRKTRSDFARYFGIDLLAVGKTGKTAGGKPQPKSFRDRYADGIPPARQGYIMTYQYLARHPAFHRRICGYRPTLVIFDEVHHLGDHPDKQWGQAAQKAFEAVPYVLCLTGTPYRCDNTRIPFVTYEECERGGLLRFKADAESGTGFTYSLGRAVSEGVCRQPQFEWHRGTVEIRPPGESGVIKVSFDDVDLPSGRSAERLRGAVTYGSPLRRQMLFEALMECRKEHRKVIIFLGGDTQGDETPTSDATVFMPAELEALGIAREEYEVITSDAPDAQEKIEAFGVSDKWILISINMVSEGTDIPELSAAIFLTTVTAKQTTIQRIGRVLRQIGENDPLKTALIFMFRDPSLVALSDEMLSEIEVEQTLRRPRESTTEGGGSPGPRSRTEVRGVEGGEIEYVKLGKREWPIRTVRDVQARLLAAGLPCGLTEAALNLILTETEARDGSGTAG